MNTRNMKRLIALPCLVLALLCMNHAVLAQTPARPRPASKAPKGTKAASNDPIVRQLQSGDVARARQALEQIRQAIQEDPKKALPQLQRIWAEPMLEAGLDEELSSLALEAIVQHPDQAPIEAMQFYRTRSLLAAGKGDAALKAAKSYYNVVALDRTKDAVDLIVEALKLAHPDQPELVFRFKQQQLYAAMATAPTSQPNLGVSILEWISAEPELYRPAIDLLAQQPRVRSNLKTLGLLLLLADRNDEALAALQEAYAMSSSDKELPDVSGNLARAMKARDRGLAQANAWVLSIRPKDSPR